MSISPGKLRSIAEAAREAQRLEILRVEEDERRQQQIQKKLLEERLERERLAQKRTIAVANRIRNAERKVIVASFNGELACDIEVEEDYCTDFVDALELIGFSVRALTTSNDAEVSAELRKVGTRLAKAIYDADAFQFENSYQPTPSERHLAEVLASGSLNTLLDEIPSVRRFLLNLNVEIRKIEDSLARVCNSCPSEGLKNTFRRILDTLDMSSGYQIPDHAGDFEDWRTEFNALLRLGCELTLADSIILVAIDTFKTIPAKDQKNVVCSAIEDAELRGQRVIELSWGAYEWETRGFSGKFDVAFATWMSSTSGQGVRTNIEASMQERAKHGLNELEISLKLLPENTKRWGPTRVWKLVVDEKPMGIFPSSPKRFATILRTIGFTAALKEITPEVLTLSITW